MRLTRRQLFATLAAAVAAPFLPPATPVRRLYGAMPGPRVGSDAFVAFYRTNLHLAVHHPAQSGWITSIDGKTFHQG